MYIRPQVPWHHRVPFSFRSHDAMKRAAPASAQPRERARRRLAPLTIETIRASNPRLEDVMGARALLRPIARLHTLLNPGCWHPDEPPLASIDGIVDALCGDGPSSISSDGDRRCWERASAANPRDLMLFTPESTPQMLAAALHAGLFPFATAVACPGRPLEARGLLNLELSGPEVSRQDGDPGGRNAMTQLGPPASRLPHRAIPPARAAVIPSL